MTSEFGHTATNMVVHVNGIIESYAMGAIRALAQEPVQNSKDAGRGEPCMEYKLLTREDSDGQVMWMLTVTDWNTSGLQGPILTLEQIDALGRLERDWNWAAFEGMHYTKENEDALGSRGQGKAAFLYHSKLPPLGTPPRARMIILYDTLLSDGEYRLGVRYATPSDMVRTPPFTGDEARQTVSSSYAAFDGTRIDLGLEPLTQVGTRVIVPYLSQAAVEAFHSEELYNWLQRCWWRAVQTGLTIHIVDEAGRSQTVAPPTWWVDEPWQRNSSNMRLWQDLGQGDARIKRMVLNYDPALDNSDTEGYAPQFCGVQLLRGQQWIETLSFHDDVPRDKRAGFRGFVEFDQRTERLLRGAEYSQHDGFDKRIIPCNVLIPIISHKVREFAEEMGWTQPQHIQALSGRERDAGMEFLRFFNPRTPNRSNSRRNTAAGEQPPLEGLLDDRWECDLTLQFPNSQTTRVDWGDYLRNVTGHVNVAPPHGSRRADVRLFLTSDTDPTDRISVDTREVEIWGGLGEASFGDFQIIRGASSHGRLQCAHEGKWKLTAEVRAGGAVVARHSRSLYVQQDPPPRNANPYTLSISAENTSQQQPRIDSGDTLGLQISAKNQTPHDAVLEVTASLGDVLLTDRQRIIAGGTPQGESARRIAAVQRDIVVNPSAGSVLRLSDTSMSLPSGQHQIRADLYVAGESEPVAHAVKTIYVDEDPARRDDWLPFNIEQIVEGGPHPRWQFLKRSEDDWTLRYSPDYPLYAALNDGGDNGRRGRSGATFVVDVCAEGLVEWALSPTGTGDESRLDDLLGSTPPGVTPDTWEAFGEKIHSLALMVVEPLDWGEITKHQRECAALMLAMYEERT